MCGKSRKILFIVLTTSCCLVAFALMTATAQQATATAQQTKETSVTFDQAHQFSSKFARGTKVELGNRTTGRITVVGWDSDQIEATATSERGIEVVNVEVSDDPAGKRIFLKADYADLGDTETRRNPSERRRAYLQTRLKAIDVRQASLKVRLAAIETSPSRPGNEERREDILSKLATLEDTRKELLGDLALLDAPEPQPSPTPATESSPQTNVIKPPVNSAPPGPPSIWSPPTSPPSPPVVGGHPLEVNLEVKLPRYAEIELITVSRSNVEVTGIQTPLVINGDKSTIKLSRVGAVEVKTGSGNVEIEDASGLVDVITASGAIHVRGAGDVRALSIGGPVEIQCARGRVDATTTDGPIKLVGISGDVDATTANSEVRFAGAIREDGRYHLKSMSGFVEMTLPPNPPGFTAILSSYKGMVSTGFLLKMKQPLEVDSSNASIPPPFSRRLIGHYGNGQAQITLDSFDGVVLLSKGTPSVTKVCQ